MRPIAPNWQNSRGESKMALKGKIIELARDRYGFEYLWRDDSKPEQGRQIWEISAYRTRGMSYCEAKDAIGREASIQDGRVSCYLGNGNYFYGELPQGGSTHSISLEFTPIVMPKVRAGIETRYYRGRWEKLLKTGWKAA
jgi:hypothetical protein